MEGLDNHQENADDPEDPLAVKVGLRVYGIPAEGWPDTFDPEVIKRILSYLPQD